MTGRRLKDWLREDGRLGLRILKTGIAATLCLLLGDLLHLQQPLVAVMAAVLSMERSMDNTVHAGAERMLGALAGILGGGLLYRISPNNAGLCGLGIVAVLYLCKILRLPRGMLMGTFCMVVMTLHPLPVGTIATAAGCAAGAGLGIGLSFVINLILFPPNYAPEILARDKLVRSRLLEAAGACENRLEPPNFNAVSHAIQSLERDIRLYTNEWKPLRNEDGSVFQIAQRIALYRDVLADLLAVDHLEKDLSPETATVFTYHLNRAKRLLESAAGPEPTAPQTKE